MTQPFDVLGLNKNLMGLNKISWDSTFSKMVSPRTQHLRFLVRTLNNRLNPPKCIPSPDGCIKVHHKSLGP